MRVVLVALGVIVAGYGAVLVWENPPVIIMRILVWALVGVVLHDLSHAASVADEVVLMRRGRVHASGLPHEVLTSENLAEVYGLPIDADHDPPRL